VSKAKSEVDETLISENSVNGPPCCKVEGVDQSRCIQQIVPASRSSIKSDSVTYASGIDGVHECFEHSSPLGADQFYRADIAAIHFISDLANCNL